MPGRVAQPMPFSGRSRSKHALVVNKRAKI
jgi:hypothetical protein